jgi:hypothetical protein
MVFRTKKRRTNIKKRVQKSRKHLRKSRVIKKQTIGGTHLIDPFATKATPNISLTILSLNCGKLGEIEDKNELNHAVKDLIKLKTKWFSELKILPDVIVMCLQETEISVVDAMAEIIIGDPLNPKYILLKTNNNINFCKT